MTITRAEHIAWCKERAMEYVAAGDPHNALNSLVSDLRKHPDTENHGALDLGLMLLLGGFLTTHAEILDWIEGVR
jgi:hypothetical protein